jgi:predicted transcriptional regulator
MLTTPPPDSPLRTLLRQWRARTRPEDLGLVRGPRQTSEAGITQEQLARRAGCTLRHYAAVEAGHALPGYTLVHRLVELFKLDDGERLELLDALMSASRNETWAQQAA